MSMYGEEQYYRDFAERTLKNLEKIETAHNNREEVYEVTQLINSFLGLIIFPHERLKKQINSLKISAQTMNEIRKTVSSTYKRDQSGISLPNIIYHVRNSAAHARIEAHSDDDHEISHLIFQDGYKSKGKVYTFEMKLSVKIIRKFVMEFGQAVIESFDNKE